MTNRLKNVLIASVGAFVLSVAFQEMVERRYKRKYYKQMSSALADNYRLAVMGETIYNSFKHVGDEIFSDDFDEDRLASVYNEEVRFLNLTCLDGEGVANKDLWIAELED